MNINNCVMVLGPTATGKTRFASILSSSFNGEIISVDSRQVYKELNLGVGKDYDDYFVNGQLIPHHLIDVADLSIEYDLYHYISDFNKVFNDIVKRDKVPFIVGGTFLYLHALLARYSLPELIYSAGRSQELEKMSEGQLLEILYSLSNALHNTTDTQKKTRIIRKILVLESEKIGIELKPIQINPLILCPSYPNDIIKNKIDSRLKERLKSGMIQEAEELIASGISHEKLRFLGLEYKFLSMYLLNELNYNDMYQKLRSAITEFAKKQRTWVRKIEKEGYSVHAVSNGNIDIAAEIVASAGFKRV
ncbi:MAG: tRNA (adenosine(37)-N6)-dimethylallyltransferase MiaA [Ignavibacteriales bacterium]|nr:tRNA (adenosine(37)-N6)-dimethylallyltransferase MiaA [Ignavibacteriales bacterium]MCF8305571.1 tRNA (adenosine(37)-N6)-dimethylallyltransferase MiaA [Ignavibacteriales bacterium]MCF8315293.1 tRNA (adenosine(37)-N6)-dimethylallyltransferase MiaA [Ignavibacteriales bacterium]MCF8436815.1 tRNA (adenosine(37)-N6)-dimethylallyltransferase MiaA [Ignavibacteriales bacterium]